MKVIVDGIAVVNVDSIVVIPDLTFDKQSGKVISRFDYIINMSYYDIKQGNNFYMLRSSKQAINELMKDEKTKESIYKNSIYLNIRKDEINECNILLKQGIIYYIDKYISETNDTLDESELILEIYNIIIHCLREGTGRNNI